MRAMRRWRIGANVPEGLVERDTKLFMTEISDANSLAAWLEQRPPEFACSLGHELHCG